jgi:hypothetical protein
MANFSLLTSIGAGATVANAFAGSAFEFIGRPSRVVIASTVIAAGASEVTGTIQFGPEIQLEEGVAAAGPSYADDVIVDDVAAPGDRLVYRLTNTGAAARDVRTKVRILPIR